MVGVAEPPQLFHSVRMISLFQFLFFERIDHAQQVSACLYLASLILCVCLHRSVRKKSLTCRFHSFSFHIVLLLSINLIYLIKFCTISGDLRSKVRLMEKQRKTRNNPNIGFPTLWSDIRRVHRTAPPERSVQNFMESACQRALPFCLTVQRYAYSVQPFCIGK